MNLNLSIEQLETVVTLLWREAGDLCHAQDSYWKRGDDDVPFDAAFCMSAGRVIFERQMLLDQIIKTIESEVGLQAVHNDKLQRCELVNKSEEAEDGPEQPTLRGQEMCRCTRDEILLREDRRLSITVNDGETTPYQSRDIGQVLERMATTDWDFLKVFEQQADGAGCGVVTG